MKEDSAARPVVRRRALDTVAALGSNRESGLGSGEARARLDRDGENEIPERGVHPLARLARKFWGLSAWMLELIAVLSFALHKRADFWIAVALLVVNALLGFLQEQRASAAVAALRRRLQVTARVLRDEAWRLVAARELVAGDIVRVRAGDFVPADAQLLDGEVRVDQSMLTGESQEIRRAADDEIHSGSTVRHGEATAIVVATGLRTDFGRTTELVGTARPKLHIEEVTSRLVRWLFTIVGALVAVALLLAFLEGMRLLDVLPLSLVLLMSAVPVALPVMFTVTTAVGSMELGRRGVLVTRLAAVEDAATMDVLCADKTGTLTLNRLSLVGLLPQPGFSAEDVARAGALASNESNQDPIDLAFLRAARDRRLFDEPARQVSFLPFSPKTRRTEAVVQVASRRVRAVKGALRTVAELVGLDATTTAALEARAGEALRGGIRVLAVARGDEGTPLSLVGLALLQDPPRADSRRLIDELRSLGIGVKMLTGDSLPVAREIARFLDLATIDRAADLRAAGKESEEAAARIAARCDGFAEVFPEDKFLVVKSLQSAGHVVGMTGDGVNDAPALRQAEVGIAVEGGTDVAKGAASVVLSTDGLAGIVDMVKTGRAIYQRLLTWIVNKISRTILKAGFVVGAFLATGKFVISALGMVLLVFLTDFVKIALSADRVHASARPETWRIGPLVKVAVVLGVLMLAESLGLLAIAGARLHVDGSRLHTFSFLTLLYFALFSIVSIRERAFFWRSRPTWILSAALTADGAVGFLVGCFGLAELPPLPFGQILLIVASASLCSLGPNDVVKTLLIARWWTRGEVVGRSK
jgi:plasma-membrane proton-efflux P-type ATPase